MRDQGLCQGLCLSGTRVRLHLMHGHDEGRGMREERWRRGRKGREGAMTGSDTCRCQLPEYYESQSGRGSGQTAAEPVSAHPRKRKRRRCRRTPAGIAADARIRVACACIRSLISCSFIQSHFLPASLSLSLVDSSCDATLLQRSGRCSASTRGRKRGVGSGSRGSVKRSS